MNAITLTPSACEAVSVNPPTLPIGLSYEQPVAAWAVLPPEEQERSYWQRQPDGTYSLAPWFRLDSAGIVRDNEGIPQTAPGSITPLGYGDLSEDSQAVIFGVHIACGLAAAARSTVAGELTAQGRDVVLCLTEDACPIGDDTLSHTFCIAEHELQPARDRVARRMAVDPDFAEKFQAARAIMNAGCVYFPWYKGDGEIPG